jgi:hypothetical protein
MAKLTWLGEDEYHDGAPGPSFCMHGSIKFPKDVPVEVTDNAFIAKARNNPFFKVEGPDEFVSMHQEPKRRGRPPKVRAEESADV